MHLPTEDGDVHAVGGSISCSSQVWIPLWASWSWHHAKWHAAW